MIEFKDKLRTLRISRKLTQQQLGELIGVKHTIISFYENGDRYPSPKVLRKLAATFHVSTDYLLGLEKHESIDISELTDTDKQLVHSIVNSLREKSQEYNSPA